MFGVHWSHTEGTNEGGDDATSRGACHAVLG